VEKRRSPLVSIPPFGRDFQGIGVFRSDEDLVGSVRSSFLRCHHRLDEPARLSLSMVASLHGPPPFHLTEYYNFAPITSLPLTQRYVLLSTRMP